MEAAAVGEDWAIPAHEFMQSTGLIENFCAGTEIKMISVSEDDLGVDIALEFARMNTLYAAASSDGHENWS